jgi:hypothetical protein
MKSVKPSFIEILPLVAHTKLFGSSIPGGQHQGYTQMTEKYLAFLISEIISA